MAHFLRFYKMLISPLFLKDVSLDRDKTIGQHLRIISKIFEKKISTQVTVIMDPLQSKYQCKFQRGFIVRIFLLGMLEKCKLSVDKGKAFGVLLT